MNAGDAALAGTLLLVATAIALALAVIALRRRGSPQVRVTVTRDALPLGGDLLDTTEPTSVLPLGPSLHAGPGDPGVAIPVATGPDPLLGLLLAPTVPARRNVIFGEEGLERPAPGEQLRVPEPVGIRVPDRAASVGWRAVGRVGPHENVWALATGREQSGQPQAADIACVGETGPAGGDAGRESPGLPDATPGFPDATPPSIPGATPPSPGATPPSIPGATPPTALSASPPDPTMPDAETGPRATTVTVSGSGISTGPGTDLPAGPGAEPQTGPGADVPGTGPGADVPRATPPDLAAAPAAPGVAGAASESVDVAPRDVATPPAAGETDERRLEGAEADASIAAAGGAPDEIDATAPADPCADEERQLRETTAVAERTRLEHDQAAARHRQLQRDYDTTTARVEAALRATDGRALLDAKESARRRFRADTEAARNAGDVEVAAGHWLDRINELNVRVRDARRVLAIERRRSTRLVSELDAAATRLDVTRIAMETADHRRHVAREALATCREIHRARVAAAALAVPGATGPTGPRLPAAEPPVPRAAPTPLSTAIPRAEEASEELEALRRAATSSRAPQATSSAMVPSAEGPPARSRLPAVPIVRRILDGDEILLAAVAGELGAGSVEETRRWHLELDAFRDAARAAAMAAAAIDLPADDPFWGVFSAHDAREIAVALSSLGYRFDGRGGFAEGRVPSARDLALAVGYAGLDPRRIRRWPPAEDMPRLLERADVRVADFVLTGAPDLALGQLVSLLGRHAADLTALWDDWGRIRPLLVAPAP